MSCDRLPYSSIAVLLACTLSAQPAAAEPLDLTELSLEQLLEVKVSSASKFEQRAADAPSAVQVISREEIQRHGWRTLMEALNSLPGIYSINDRAYDFMGSRGFLIPGDYNTRFLLLIDGQRNNDNVYQQAVLGTESWVNMTSVDHIEYIPGPGSALYGSNAMFGVINVITRSAGESAQSQVSSHVSQLGLTSLNVLTSQRIDNTGLVLQYSSDHQSGRDQTYNDPLGLLFRADGTPASDGIAHGLDSGNNHQLMVRVDRGEWNFRLINHERKRLPSSALYQTVFDDPSLNLKDGGTQLTTSVQHPLSDASSVYARLAYTDWHYRATYPYLDPVLGYYRNYDDTQGQMLDGEFHFDLQNDAHHLITGLDFSQDLMARQHNYYSIDPALLGTVATNINPLVKHSGLFLQDEWRFSADWLLSLGLRHDSASSQKSTLSPRLGLIWQPSADWTAKLLSGRAYRSPNAYESMFSQGTLYLSNPNLNAETIRTTEGVLEWKQNNQTRWTLSVFDNKLDQLIYQNRTGGTLQYQNGGRITAQGAELGLQKQTAADLKLRASLAYTDAKNSSAGKQENSPSWVGKFSASAPVLNHAANLGGELSFIGQRHFTWQAQPYSVSNEVIANATLTFPNLLTRGLQAQFRITNLFNRNAPQPAAAEMLTPTTPNNGRDLSATISYEF